MTTTENKARRSRDRKGAVYLRIHKNSHIPNLKYSSSPPIQSRILPTSAFTSLETPTRPLQPATERYSSELIKTPQKLPLTTYTRPHIIHPETLSSLYENSEALWQP